MTILSYIIWNFDPEIFTFTIPFTEKEITVRWYGLLFAAAFLVSQQLLYYIFRKEGKPAKDVDTLTIYMVIATILGARLGHVIFYQPEMFIDNPLGILLPVEFSPQFRIVGFQGLASHGGAIGILLALWLYARKKKPGQNYLQILDRIVILVAITGAFIRFGNFMNSEIIGKPTNSDSGVVFARNITEVIKNGHPEVIDVHYIQRDSTDNSRGYKPVTMLVDFAKDSTTTVFTYKQIVQGITRFSTPREHFDALEEMPTRIVQNDIGGFSSLTLLYMIPRYPAQLYESISCVLLFGFLFWLWHKKRDKLKDGTLFALFLIICFGLRFLFEFLKEEQVDFEVGMPLNMGQILSIPLFLAGIFLLYWIHRGKSAKSDSLDH